MRHGVKEEIRVYLSVLEGETQSLVSQAEKGPWAFKCKEGEKIGRRGVRRKRKNGVGRPPKLCLPSRLPSQASSPILYSRGGEEFYTWWRGAQCSEVKCPLVVLRDHYMVLVCDVWNKVCTLTPVQTLFSFL